MEQKIASSHTSTQQHCYRASTQFTDLPNELLLQVASLLGQSDLRALIAVCHQLLFVIEEVRKICCYENALLIYATRHFILLLVSIHTVMNSAVIWMAYKAIIPSIVIQKTGARTLLTQNAAKVVPVYFSTLSTH